MWGWGENVDNVLALEENNPIIKNKRGIYYKPIQLNENNSSIKVIYHLLDYNRTCI